MARTRHSARLLFDILEGRDVPATAAGALDTSFGINGLQSLTFPVPGAVSPQVNGYASAVQSDGKIIIVGTEGPATNGPNQYTSGTPSPDFGVFRLNPNGSLDTTFGVDGRASIPFDLGTGNVDLEDHAFAVGIQSNGDIVVAGSAINATTSYPTSTPLLDDEWAVTRLTVNGVLDTTFGTNGLTTFAYGTYDPATGITDPTTPVPGTAISDMVIQPDDHILLVGTLNGTGAATNQFDIARLIPTGQLDPSFGVGANGEETLPVPSILPGTPNPPGTSRPNYANTTIAVAPNGTIYVAASIVDQNNDFVVAATDPYGIGFLTSFGNGGIAVANLPTVDPTTGLKTNFNGMVGAIAVQPDGKILVTGGKAYTSANAVGDFITVRFNTNGTLDNTFGTKGISEIPFSIGGANTDVGEGIAIQPDGKIVIGGEVQSGGDFFGSPVYPTYIFGAARLTTNGALDTTFGTGGKQTYSINNPAGVGDLVGVHSVNFSTGGKIILVGNDSQRVAIIQLTNNTTFNPLPPPPAPATGLPPPVASPGTTVSEFAASGDGTRLTTYQGTKPPDYQYDPTQASNLTVLPTVQMLTDGFNGVIRSAIGDVDGNGVPDIIVVTGPGTPTRWAVINGSDPQEFLIPPLPAFTGSEMFSGGAYVSVGDFDNDGKDEIVLSADQGGGPRITIFSFNAATPPAPTVDANFYGIADPNFRGGTRTAVGDLNGDGVPDLAVATGNGGGPRIALYDGTSLFTTQTKLINDFYAFDSSLRDGAYVAIGDVNGDGFGDLVFGAGDGGAPQVLVINGQKALSNLTAALAAPIESFFVNGDSTDRGGVRVAVKDVDADNKADIITGSGVYQQSQINVYLGSQLSIGDTTAEQTLDPFATILPNGIYVG